MHPTKAAELYDQINLVVHWLALIVLALLLGEGAAVSSVSILFLVLSTAWTLTLTVFAISSRRLPNHPVFCLAADSLLASLFLTMVLYQGTGFYWAGLLPILTAAVYYRFQGGGLAALVVILINGVVLTTQLGNAQAIAALVMPAVVLGLTGLAVGMVAQQVGYLVQHRQEIVQEKAERSRQQEHDRIRALYKVTSTLTATLNFQIVLDRALDVAADVLIEKGKDNLLVSAVLLFSEDQLYVGSSRRLTPSDQKVTLQAREGLIFDSLRSGQARAMIGPAADPELLRIVALRSCGSVYCYPLRNNKEIFGALVFGHPEPDFFDPTRSEILEIIGRQAVVALQNAILYGDLEREKERIINIQEDARKQLARDLHDGPTQLVAAIAMRVNFARRMIERDINAAADELYKVEDLARRATKEIRHMLFTLRPLSLETGGLVPALESMAEKSFETYGQRVYIEASSEAVAALELNKQGVVFYIAEEAISNARKHAEAESITVRLSQPDAEISLLEIVDNGVGFNVGEVDAGYAQRSSLGMVNMRERTELLNGVFQLESAIGKGTHIRVWIPTTEAAAQRLKRGQPE
jgi:signal transduction histidine kinase